MKKYTINRLTATAVGAMILFTGVSQADATTNITKVNKTVKLQKGKLVQKTSNKPFKGYALYKGKLYKNSSLFSGIIQKKYYKKGVLSTGIYKSKYYKKGVLSTGIYKSKYYKKGVLSTGIYKSKYYKKGVLSTGIYKSEYYKKGVLSTGIYKSKYYKKGVLFTGTFAKKVYVKGKLDKKKTALLKYKEDIGSYEKNTKIYNDLLQLKTDLLTISDRMNIILDPTALPSKKMQTKTNFLVITDIKGYTSFLLNPGLPVYTQQDKNNFSQFAPQAISTINNAIFPAQAILIENATSLITNSPTMVASLNPSVIQEILRDMQSIQRSNQQFLAQPQLAANDSLVAQRNSAFTIFDSVISKMKNTNSSIINSDEFAALNLSLRVQKVERSEEMDATAYIAAVQKTLSTSEKQYVTFQSEGEQVTITIKFGVQEKKIVNLSPIEEAKSSVNKLFSGEDLQKNVKNLDFLAAKLAVNKLKTVSIRDELLQKIQRAENLFKLQHIISIIEAFSWGNAQNSDEVKQKLEEEIKLLAEAHEVSIESKANEIQVSLSNYNKSWLIQAPWYDAEQAIQSLERNDYFTQTELNAAKSLAEAVTHTQKKEELFSRIQQLQQKLNHQISIESLTIFNNLINAVTRITWSDDSGGDQISGEINAAIAGLPGNSGVTITNITSDHITVMIKVEAHEKQIILTKSSTSEPDVLHSNE